MSASIETVRARPRNSVPSPSSQCITPTSGDECVYDYLYASRSLVPHLSIPSLLPFPTLSLFLPALFLPPPYISFLMSSLGIYQFAGLMVVNYRSRSARCHECYTDRLPPTFLRGGCPSERLCLCIRPFLGFVSVTVLSASGRAHAYTRMHACVSTCFLDASEHTCRAIYHCATNGPHRCKMC